MRGLGSKLDDDFVQDAVAAVESDVFGDAENWIVTISDMVAVCKINSRVEGGIQRGQPIAPHEFEDILRNEIWAEGATPIGAIQGGIGDNRNELADTYIPAHVAIQRVWAMRPAALQKTPAELIQVSILNIP